MKINHISEAIILLFLISSGLILSTEAASTAVIPTFILVSASPSPVGVGQPLYVNAFLSKPTVTAAGPQGDRYEGLVVNIVKPDGSNETFGPYQADATGGIWFTYTPQTVGNYSVQALYPGQVLKNGDITGTSQYNGLTYLPSISDVAHFTVQQEQVTAQYNTPALPSEYWSRPIYASNYNWATLGGSWFGLKPTGFTSTGVYDATGAFQPYSKALNTGHIVWVKPTKFGGQVGSPMPNDQTYQYSATSILQTEFEPIILNGILYYCTYPSAINIPDSWQAIDLRTGQPLSTWNTTAGLTGTERLRYGEIVGFHSIQEYGAFPLLWSIQTEVGKAAGAYGAAQSAGAGTAPTNVTFRLYDPMTGYYYCSIVNGTDMQMIADYNPDTTEPGTLLGWLTSSNSSGTYLSLWNSTRCILYPWGYTGKIFQDSRTNTLSATERVFRLGVEGPNGNWSIMPFSSGYQWTVKVPNTLNGVNVTGLNIAVRSADVILLRTAPSTASASAGYQITVGINARTGAVLWGPINQTIPAYRDISVLGGNKNVYVIHDKDTDQAYGYSMKDGSQLWGPVQLPGNAWSRISRAAEIAYGNIYIYDYGGYCNALNLQTGAINWTYTPAAVPDIPDGTYPFWTYNELVCDGKIFLPQGKLYDPPLSPGNQRIVLNCTDGSLVYSELGYYGRVTAAAADGYVVQWNSYDKQIYTIGRGQTQTTVQVGPKTMTMGGSVQIEGTVMDKSPGTTDSDRAARFPNGVPVIADKDMSHWMEYVYMQQDKPTNLTGVPVAINVLDSNGNYRTIGTTTSNAEGFYTYNWTPDIAGTYTVYAIFAGTESYYGSNAVTSFNTAWAPEPTATAASEVAQPPTEMYFAISTAAIIAAIAIVGAVLLLALRKRP